MPERLIVQESLKDIPPGEFVEIALGLPHPLSTPKEVITRYSTEYRAFFGLANNLHSRILNELGEEGFGNRLHSGLERLGLGLQAWYEHLEHTDLMDPASAEAMVWLQELASAELLEAVATYTDQIFKAWMTEYSADETIETIAEEIDEIIEPEIPAFDELCRKLLPRLIEDGQTIEELNHELLGVRLGAAAVRNSLIIAGLNEIFLQS